jgi:hypothetical protein
LRLDAAMESLLLDIRVEQMQAGLVSYQQYSATSLKQRVIELSRSELINQRNIVRLSYRYRTCPLTGGEPQRVRVLSDAEAEAYLKGELDLVMAARTFVELKT